MQEKKPVVIDTKKYQKIKPFETKEEVLLSLRGEEPRRGVITNITEYKGEKIYQVTFPNGDQKWGSVGQIRRVTNEVN